jgi:2-polyprenyl-3-methyl-5-hydroxy-6-metoxy-1,4-benzoquinol methylase
MPEERRGPCAFDAHGESCDRRRGQSARVAGGSSDEIHVAALRAADPQPNLRWLDIGCGTGNVLRSISERHRPRSLIGLDVIDWLAPDLRSDVDLVAAPAEEALSTLEPVDRILMVEVLEHLDAPWTVLRLAADLVADGGRIVVTTPNIASLRHRVELLTRGSLTAFREDNLPHMTPALPHVVSRLLRTSGLKVDLSFAGRDIVPLSGGRLWPQRIAGLIPSLANVSTVIVGDAGPRQRS